MSHLWILKKKKAAHSSAFPSKMAMAPRSGRESVCFFFFFFYKKAEFSAAKRGITNGREMMAGGCLPTPGIFGKASPQIRRAGRGGGPHQPPRTVATSRRGGTTETAPELPTPRTPPPAFKYSSRTGKGSQLLF